MQWDKAPDRDVMTLTFVKDDWVSLRDDFIRLFDDFHVYGKFVLSLNSTLVSLIVKKASA